MVRCIIGHSGYYPHLCVLYLFIKRGAIQNMSKKMKTMDGNTAAGYISYAFTDVAAIYPMTRTF